MITAVELARQLIAIDTVNPPGNESRAARFLGDLLAGAGFATSYFEFAPGRTSLLASLPGSSDDPPIAFTGHLDTVPLGDAAWSHDPFGGEIHDGRLYGRGASDMKGAVAAMVTMALAHAHRPPPRAALLLLITAGEETTCQGAEHLARVIDLSGKAGALIVGEPTSNHPVIAHKGCARYRIATRGIAAHGSMPGLGVNAIHRMAEVIEELRRFDFEVPPHPVLGGPTLNIGTIRGGSSINSVADAAEIGVDIRLLPGQEEASVRQQLQAALGPECQVELLESAASVATEPSHPWVQQVTQIMERRLEAPVHPAGVPYFTDASVLTSALGNPPTIILGPGDAAQAHTTDESCSVALLEMAVEAYAEIASTCRAVG